MRKKISDIARPEPLEFEDEAGKVVFTMPRRLVHLSPAERALFEAASSVAHGAAVAFVDFLQATPGADMFKPESKVKRDELAASMSEANFAVLSLALPGITREQFDGLSELQAGELMTEFQTSPFRKPTADPETSDSAAI